MSANPALNHLLKHCAPAAFHNSRERLPHPKCHPGTRTSILRAILDPNPNSSMLSGLLLWLRGTEGAGKSAIAQTVAEILYRKQRLAAAFFFSQLPGDSHRHNEERLITTIAYQLTQNIPAIRPYIEDVIESNPAVFALALQDQVQALILEPFSQLRKSQNDLDFTLLPRAIIVDGLDHCGDGEAQVRVLNVLLHLVRNQETFPFSVIITSRPKYRIQGWFDQCSDPVTLYPTALPPGQSDNRGDITRFVTDKINEIVENHPSKHLLPPGWPPKKLIQTIVNRSSGRFVIPQKILGHLRHGHSLPSTRLAESIIRQVAGQHGGSNSSWSASNGVRLSLQAFSLSRIPNEHLFYTDLTMSALFSSSFLDQVQESSSSSIAFLHQDECPQLQPPWESATFSPFQFGLSSFEGLDLSPDFSPYQVDRCSPETHASLDYSPFEVIEPSPHCSPFEVLEPSPHTSPFEVLDPSPDCSPFQVDNSSYDIHDLFSSPLPLGSGSGFRYSNVRSS